jgi:alkanesulfonate monooxygenase SsuD/methylene tetrahydromethanopterin reductase-like flavin-dependent oxidoreductase (luciferase family)
VHFGVILPNYGHGSTPGGIRRVAELAEQLGFDSVWTTEHVIVGPEAVEPYGRVYAPLATLAWIAGWTERIRLGTSIMLAPLHHPAHLAKETATLQELSGGRLHALGVGMGWHRDEFEYMGVPFEGRGRRGDDAIRMLKALWNGDHVGTSEPQPSPVPEIWVGGSSERAIRRALELGDAWHPSRGSEVDHVRSVKERYPELRVVPRTRPHLVDGMLEAGAEGAVVTFPDEAAMRDFARGYLR